MIKPTVGRVVHFWPHPMDELVDGHDQPLAALIVHVWNEGCVNLTVFDANGIPHGRTSVVLHQDGNPKPDCGYCEWMEYQKGQAAKTEAAEKALDAVTKPAAEETVEQMIQDKGLNAPRVTPQRIQAVIRAAHYFTAAEAADAKYANLPDSEREPLRLLTFCVLVLQNGFTVTGESACASPENFNEEIGRKVARENAENKIWQLEGYLLKEKLFRNQEAGTCSD